MNRRAFVKSTVFLFGLVVTNPRRFIGVFQAIYKEPLSWRDKILHLYPAGDAPIFEYLKHHSKPCDDPKPVWWDY